MVIAGAQFARRGDCGHHDHRSRQGHPGKRRLQYADGLDQAGRGPVQSHFVGAFTLNRRIGSLSLRLAGPGRFQHTRYCVRPTSGRSRSGMLASSIIFFACTVRLSTPPKKRPQRDVPIGIIRLCLCCTVLYIAPVPSPPAWFIQECPRMPGFPRVFQQTKHRCGFHHCGGGGGRHYFRPPRVDAQRAASIPGHGP